MNALKVKTIIECNTCGCTLKRTKTIKVESSEKDAAKKEASAKIVKWQESLKGANCKVCASIIKEVAA